MVQVGVQKEGVRLVTPGEPISYSEGQLPSPALGRTRPSLVGRFFFFIIIIFLKEKLEIWFLLILIIVILCPM